MSLPHERRPRRLHAVQTQQQFLAYAAHELRGEITLQLTLARGDARRPERGHGRAARDGRGRRRRLLAARTVARGAADARPERVRTSAARARRPRRDGRRVLRAHDHHGLRSTTALEPARTTGDPQLVKRLVANLVANAVRHNIPGGRLDVVTYTAAGRATFTIANTGPVIPTGELSRLFQPFQRLNSHAGPSTDGVGLGLAIVQAIADAHEATVTAQARTGGGLGIDVAFPALD